MQRFFYVYILVSEHDPQRHYTESPMIWLLDCGITIRVALSTPPSTRRGE
ncbi:hypothetical protein BH20VER1_BH20VER1_11360 [soil metagenome]